MVRPESSLVAAMRVAAVAGWAPPSAPVAAHRGVARGNVEREIATTALAIRICCRRFRMPGSNPRLRGHNYPLDVSTRNLTEQFNQSRLIIGRSLGGGNETKGR